MGHGMEWAVLVRGRDGVRDGGEGWGPGGWRGVGVKGGGGEGLG